MLRFLKKKSNKKRICEGILESLECQNLANKISYLTKFLSSQAILLLSYWQITHDHKYIYIIMMMGDGLWEVVSRCMCMLFVVHCKNRVGSLVVVHHPVLVIFDGGARRKQFMSKGRKVGPLH
jgi:hypothetical protein